jgi:hypothetical protein
LLKDQAVCKNEETSGQTLVLTPYIDLSLDAEDVEVQKLPQPSSTAHIFSAHDLVIAGPLFDTKATALGLHLDGHHNHRAQDAGLVAACRYGVQGFRPEALFKFG